MLVERLILAVGDLVGHYNANPQENWARGNVAICIVDDNGGVAGRIWGKDKVMGRSFFKNAWVKASQVWITGMKTGEYERRLYNDEFPEERYGINKPDLIGWEGGQPVVLKDGTTLAIGFSGYSGRNDLEIVARAVAKVESEL